MEGSSPFPKHKEKNAEVANVIIASKEIERWVWPAPCMSRKTLVAALLAKKTLTLRFKQADRNWPNTGGNHLEAETDLTGQKVIFSAISIQNHALVRNDSVSLLRILFSILPRRNRDVFWTHLREWDVAAFQSKKGWLNQRQNKRCT